MWLPISVGLRLNQPLAMMFDRVFVDIAFYRVNQGTENSSLVNVFRDLNVAFDRFSSLPESATMSQSFRQAPLCFAPVFYSPSALYGAADLAACFAYGIGKLLEEHLDLPPAVEIPSESDRDALARVQELTGQISEILRSGDLATVVLAHRMLLHAQVLCALLTRFRQLRALAHSVLSMAAPVLTEPPMR
jgi:hypothetical protein